MFHFRSNNGQAAALFFGMKQATGEVLVTLDGDGQNDPADIPRLLAALRDCDMVAGIRARRHDSWLRLAMSRLANSIRSRFLGDGLRDTGCALKAFRREVVEAFIPIRTLYSFMGAMAVAAGFRLRQLEVAHRPRTRGESNYGFSVFWWKPLIDMLGLFWFSRRRFSGQIDWRSDLGE
jgi:dolichol-phosphate mannosyltransferase